MLPNHSSHRGPFIGLDIGSRAVRAAELTVKGGHTTLQRFAQVELPVGAVADGEVVDSAAVGEALKQLWAEGKFSHRRVVVGVSSQRAIVRLADVPAMTDAELRTALKFEAEDLIPIPVEEAVLDFSTVDRRLATTDPTEPPKMRILLAAAQRDMVNGHLGALKAAGLRPVAVDPVALALLRAVPPSGPSTPSGESESARLTEAVVAIGAGSTTVAIRENGIARFVRVLNVGGDDLAAAIAPSAPAAANAGDVQQAKVAGPGQVATIGTVKAAVGGPLRALVDDIRGSVDFYLAQSDTDRVDRIVLTGGAALSEGLLPRLQDALRQTVEIANPLSTVALGKTGLTEEQLRDAAPYLVTPIGLALWATVPGRPISLLPDEVLLAKRAARQAVLVGCAMAAFAAILGLAWAGRAAQVTGAQHRASQAEAQVSSLNRQIATTSDITRVQADVKAHEQMYATALSGEIDWIRLIEQITAVMPNGVHLTTLTVGRQASAGATGSVGTISIGAVGTGGPDKAAEWLRALATLPGLAGTSVQSITATTGPTGTKSTSVVFTSTSGVTPAAESQRSLAAAGAAK